MSADVNPQKIEKALSLGAKKYLTKPIELEVLIGLIDKWMGFENN
jgi:CheY-like chemotaxis protein